jgi:hypothetical protein
MAFSDKICTASLSKKMIVSLVFDKNDNFVVKNGQKSQEEITL